MNLKLAASFLACALVCAAQNAGNHLVNEKSPYLLLHAHNPVDWYPWGEAAFEKASREQKPIFLSIGYYTCHWCHVMEQESYSNPVIAEVLNKYFVSIKVDREERPDVDRLYMAYLESLPGTAGWPANIFLTPDRKPFLGGVYFAPDKLKKLLEQVADDWSKDRDRTVQKASRAAEALVKEASGVSNASSAPLPPAALDKAWRDNAAIYDSQNGGFGVAPKFPRPVTLEFLLRTSARSAGKARRSRWRRLRSRLWHAVAFTIKLAGASIDTPWMRNGGFRISKRCFTIRRSSPLSTARRIRSRMTAAMRMSRAAYSISACANCSFQVAVSARRSTLTVPLLRASRRQRKALSITGPPRKRSKVLGESSTMFDFAYGIEQGASVPWRAHTDDETAKRFGMNAAQAGEKLTALRAKMMEARSHRQLPPRDDKAVTTWNAMMISAFARAA